MTATYAALLAIAIGAGYAIAAGAADPHFAGAAILLGYILLVSALEARFPFEPGWQPTRADIRDDAVFFAATLLASYAGNAAADALGRSTLASIGSELTGIAPCLAFLVALLIADCCMYWVHRSFHQPVFGKRALAWLWPLHRVHHMEEKLYLFNNSRMHPINQLLNSLVRSVPLVVLGFPTEVCAGAIFTISCVSYLAHANLNVRNRFLGLTFNTPAFHRVHHNRNPDIAQNFGSFLAVWDHLFGTYRIPDMPHDIGIPSPERRPQSLMARFLRP